ncbi:GIY-YIG nuclease family protein, partial [Acidobacteriota bacterium]
MEKNDRIELKTKVNRLPQKPGIYFFRSTDNVVVYIGKARSLRERVKSYLAPTSDPKVHSILAETSDVDYLLTDSEKEASFLENNFIQQYQPKFNIKLKDDKAFPFLKVTCKEKYPGIYLTRRVEADGAKYIGPFFPAHQARKNIHLVNKYFGIRNCQEAIPGKRKRPCLEYDLKFCSGPCVGYITEEEYKSQVDSALLFLEGRTEDLLKILKPKMRKKAESQEFEHAALLRDLILSIEQLKEKPKLISVKKENKDIFGFSRVGDEAYLSLFRMRKGKVIESEILSGKKKRKQSASEFLASKLT